VLGGVTVKQLVELSGQHLSIRAIARRLDISRNTVRKYLRAPGLPVAKPRPRRPSKLDPFRDYVASALRLARRIAWSCCASCAPRATLAATRF
jgi:transposase